MKNMNEFFSIRDSELDKLIDPATGKIYANLLVKVNCLLCGADNYRYLFTKNGFDFVRCENCTLTYVNPQLNENVITEQYNDGSKTTDAAFFYLASYSHQDIREKLYEQFLREIKATNPTGKVLDIGCSIGQFLRSACSRGYDTLGLELNERASNYARIVNKVKVENKLLADCHFENNSFDIISMFGVIEHLPQPIIVVSEIYRILKPNGVLIGICPNVESFVCMVLHSQSRTFTGQLHLSYFSARTLCKLFTTCGFKDENINIRTKYTGRDSLINYFQMLKPFDSATYNYLPDKFRNFLLGFSVKNHTIMEKQEDRIDLYTQKTVKTQPKKIQIEEDELETAFDNLGIGLKLIFIARK